MGRRGEEGGGEGKEDEAVEKEGLPPLEWRSGYAPDFMFKIHRIRMRICCAIKIISYFRYCDST